MGDNWEDVVSREWTESGGFSKVERVFGAADKGLRLVDLALVAENDAGGAFILQKASSHKTFDSIPLFAAEMMVRDFLVKDLS